MLLNFPAYRRFHDLQERTPALKLVTVPLRKVILAADRLLALLLFVFWMCFVGLPTRLGLFYRKRRPSGKICFLSQEGFAVAPTRVRTYSFANRVSSQGLQTSVLAFWDDIYRFERLPQRTLLLTECVIVSLRAAHRLLCNPPAAIVQQRPNYELITTWILWFLRDTPIIFDIDDWIFDDHVFCPPIRVRQILPYANRVALGCVVSSTRLEEELKGCFPSIAKIPTFVDTQRFQPRRARSSDRDVVFGWNGTLFEGFMYEALMVMVRAFVGACDRLGPDVPIRLEIAGVGAHLPAVERTIAASFPNYPIHIKGWIDPKTMPEYLDGIDVGLYSLPGDKVPLSPRDACFIPSKSPTKVFEYMAKGIPTIATGVGEVRYFIDPSVTGFCSDDPSEIINAFVILAKDAELRERMGVTARKVCLERFTLDIAGRDYASYINEVCGSRLRSALVGQRLGPSNEAALTQDASGLARTGD